MTREARSVRCPESVLGWIPWYGEYDEQGDLLLNPRQRGAVEAHASQCADCRAELEMISGAPYQIDVDLPDPDRIFDEITARLDSGESEATAPDSLSPVIPLERARPLSSHDYRKLASWVLNADEDGSVGTEASEDSSAQPAAMLEPTITPFDDADTQSASGSTGTVVEGPWNRTGAWAAVAAAAIFVLGLVSGGVLNGSLSPSTSTQSGQYDLASVGAAASAPMLDVVFSDRATASEISASLNVLGVEIVSGPSSIGRYRLQQVTDASGSAATTVSTAEDAAAELAEIAARLKAGDSPIALFAEPALK